MAGTARFNGEVGNIESNINKVDSFDESISDDAAKQKYPSLKCLKEFLSVIYPVGAIYISAASTSPATLFGGTWERIKDTFLLAAGDTYSAGETGGETKHKLTTDEMPSHKHSYNSEMSGKEGGALAGFKISYGTAYNNTETQGIFDTGGNQPHNNMPPYLAVYVWQRTA